MADERLTMLDAVKAREADDVVGLIEEVVTSAPEFGLLPAKIITGTSYKTRFRTAYPTAAFRDANEGIEASKSTYELRATQLKLIDSLIQADKAIADQWDGGPDAYKFEEALGVMEAAIIKFGYQVYYGNPSATDKGFPGLQYQVDPSMVVDAGGTTDSVASSVYALRLGERDVTGIFGGDKTMTMEEWIEQYVTLSAGGQLRVYSSSLNSWVGVQNNRKYSCARIKKITTDSGKGMTDALVAELLSKFPAGIKPEVLMMTPRSLLQLQQSRTATNPTGAPAPIPDSSHGVRIVATDSIVNTELLAS